MGHIKLVLAQINPLVGDIMGNTQLIIEQAQQAMAMQADCVIFPELCLTGYPPEDLLLRPELYTQLEHAKQRLATELKNIDFIIGYPRQETSALYNTAAYYRHGKCLAEYDKQALPNYSVFDEKRYFSPGKKTCAVDIKGIKFALLICEDIWFPEAMQQAKQAAAQCAICINASPFSTHKDQQRQQVLDRRHQETSLPIIYVNCVGAQDELVFDGGSMAIGHQGDVVAHSAYFRPTLHAIAMDRNAHLNTITANPKQPSLTEKTYQALILGVQDYVNKNGFKKVIIGLSGGIDSALTLAIAYDALGPDMVHTVAMPSRYTAETSNKDASEQATLLGVSHEKIPIEPMVQAFEKSLAKHLSDEASIPQQNIQARVRGILLMAISNQTGALLLSTGNKSELSVGYTTLYGDMAGGFSVLKDISKTWVYKLAAYRNQLSPCIPENVITRPPSAELANNQCDQDTLPPYDILDQVLERYIEKDQSLQQIVASGFDPAVVSQVIKMVDNNEYKRRQAPPGIKISERAFGRDRRYPITSGFQTSVDSPLDAA